MIFVTGATGRLGGFVRRRAARNGIAIRHLDGPSLRAEEYRSFAGSDAVLHLAGATPRSGTAPDARAFHEANVGTALRVVEAAARYGVPRVLLVSSASVYGRPDTPHRIFDEAAPIRPLDEYGRSKATMEREARRLARMAGMPEISILRIANVAGADQLLLNARAATPDAPLRLDRFASGRGPLRSYIGPASLGDVLLTLAACPAPLPEVLNIALPTPLRMDAVLRILDARHPVPWTWRAAPESAIERVAVDTTALERIYAFGSGEDACDDLVSQVLDVWATEET